ncbi:MAG: hypothetical protein ACD_40C00190G0002 [uncultured bacterium]|nr:MAG: hypothetical protein ACD_40C00190G0002 [uncultured bacterium]KKU14675.1 MAG: hypothetical protein UX21_C0013G0008 [Microgenomates group bacterium GW2011_GWC2_45_8]KKU26483.1 MAG: hypothetical protein UX37_C0002G0049 [Microgenomates group bacterium GW2011_GWA2_46_16]
MKIIKILFIFIVILVLGNVTLTNRSVDESITISQLSREIKSLEDQNILTQARIAHAGSLTFLQAKIVQAGYVESPYVVSLPTPSSVALR